MDTDTITHDETEEKTKIAYPKNYKVILLNDDFTPMEFVVRILVLIFHMDPQRAIAVMMEVHEKGRGVAGVYNYEVAEQKKLEVIATARSYQHPLMAELEEDV